ncbi:MAG: hypothetical protein KGK16_13495, partial [Bradyrhizobium sp.]|nr:hypothetical protein [Bradyrhizobium sp.]
KIPALITPKNAVTASNMMTILRPQQSNQTPCQPAQSKGFGVQLKFQNWMMISCNRLPNLPRQIGRAGQRND